MASAPIIPTRSLGKNGPQVPRLGLGLMGTSGIYGLPAPDSERLHFLDEAFKRGERFWDTSDMYGDSEDLLGKWFAANPEKRKDIFLATKFAIKVKLLDSGDIVPLGIDSSPDYCRLAIDKSLKRLGLSYVDLYYVHRLDKATPIEKTMEALVELKSAGKIKHIGLSECSAESLRRAHAVHPISCIQVEYNPFFLDIESPQINLLETARELGVAIVTYSPLANGILSGTIRSRDDASKPGDSRAGLPWLHDGNIEKNLAIVDKIWDIAKKKGVTGPQLTLAWILHQGDDFFPIPGTTKIHRLEENIASLDISVTPEEDVAIRELSQQVAGDRFQTATGFAFADTPPL